MAHFIREGISDEKEYSFFKLCLIVLCFEMHDNVLEAHKPVFFAYV